jgi:hypothetical protein
VNRRFTDITRSVAIALAWLSALIGALIFLGSTFLMFMPIDGGNPGFGGFLVGLICLFIGGVVLIRRKPDRDEADDEGKKRHETFDTAAVAVIVIAIGTSVLWAGGLIHSRSPPREQFTVIRRVLIPQEHVEAHIIVSVPGGDFIVAGARNTADHHAWASRVNSMGQMRWEFLDKAPENSTIFRDGGSFRSVVTLPDNTTLLCGTRPVERELFAFIVHLDVTGNVIEQRNVYPGEERRLAGGGIVCMRWGDGVAMLGGVYGAIKDDVVQPPKSTGWLVKFDSTANPVWEKFDDHYCADNAIENTDHHLIILCNSLGILDENGNVMASHEIDSAAYLIRPLTASTRIRIGLPASPTSTRYIDYDLNFHVIRRTNQSDTYLDLEKAFELADRSIIVFGNRLLGRPIVTRVYNDWHLQDYLIDRESRGWIEDAVQSSPNEFVTVGRFDLDTWAIEWVSFKSANH